MKDTTPIYAHTMPGKPCAEWETLEDHAEKVARLAKEFAGAFGAGEWGELLGRKLPDTLTHFHKAD